MGTSGYAVLLSFLCLNVHLSTAAPIGILDEPVLADAKNEVSYRISSVAKHCTLFATDDETADRVRESLSSGANLFKFVLKLPGSEQVFKNDNSSLIYKPLSWVRTPGRLGNGLLLLRPEYDVLSLNTLELRVATMDIEVEATPSGCLSSLSDLETEKVIRALVMNHFENSSSEDIDSNRPHDQVCNIHVTNTSGVANFRYFCCRHSGPSHVHCRYLESDTWLGILFSVMTFTKVVVILFSPRFVPDSFYRIRHKAQVYRHRFLDGRRLTINTVATKTPDSKQFANRVMTTLPKSKFNDMEGFQDCLDKLLETEDQPYRLVLNDIRFCVSRGRLLDSASAPVGLFNMFYEAFFKCQISERDALQECCNADMLQKLPCKRTCSFLRFCKELMKLALVLLLAVPWIIRAVAYYKFEHGEVVMQKEAAKNRGLVTNFPGNFTLLLTPLHVVFIFVYVVLSFEMCICGVTNTFGRKVSETMRFVTRKCFRDMREKDNTDIVGWAVKLSLKPCSSLGMFGVFIGLLLWPVLLPLILIVWAFYMFPTVNITFRLLGDLFYYLLCCKKKRQNRQDDASDNLRSKNKIYERLYLEQLRAPESSSQESKKTEQAISKCVQPLIILCSLVSLYSIILLFTELVSFVVEIVIYTMMGLILNAGTIMTYLSLGLLLGLYGNECFGYVTNTFLAFNKKMNQIAFGLAIEKVENVIYTKEDKQENVAFRVKTDRCEVLDKPVSITVSPEGQPSWSVGRLLLFLDKTDQPLIPSKLYFKACKMDYYAAPGELLFRYMSAAVEFGCILLFLIFVLLVVLAFGDSYEISSTNKLFATTLGGFVPLLLRKVVFKPHAVPEIDQSSIHFQVSLTDLIEPYQELWPIFDIDVESVEVLDDYDGPIDLLIDTS